MPIRIFFLAALLALTGCDAATETMQDRVKLVQKYTVDLCKYLPTVSSVTAVLTAGNPAVTESFAVAQAICVAVARSQSKATLYKDCPRVNGVCVEGTYLDNRIK